MPGCGLRIVARNTQRTWAGAGVKGAIVDQRAGGNRNRAVTHNHTRCGIQESPGQFHKRTQPPMGSAEVEEMAPLFVDVDGDQDA